MGGASLKRAANGGESEVRSSHELGVAADIAQGKESGGSLGKGETREGTLMKLVCTGTVTSATLRHLEITRAKQLSSPCHAYHGFQSLHTCKTCKLCAGNRFFSTEIPHEESFPAPPVSLITIPTGVTDIEMSDDVAEHASVAPLLPITYEHGRPYEDVENNQKKHKAVMESLMLVLEAMAATVRLWIASTICQSVARGWRQEEGRFSVLRDRGVHRWGAGGVARGQGCVPQTDHGLRKGARPRCCGHVSNAVGRGGDEGGVHSHVARFSGLGCGREEGQ